MKNAVIFGSGLAGSLIGNELSKSFKVTILEAGPQNGIQYPNVEFVNKDFGVVKTFCMGEGGTTNLWHNGLMPINPEDVHSLEFKEVLDNASCFVDKAASKLFFGEKSYQGEYGAICAEMNALKKDLAIFPDGLDFLLYPKKYSKLIADSGAQVHYGVKNICFKERGEKIAGIFYWVKNVKYSLKPDIVIFSGGALGTPFIVGRLISDTGLSFYRIGMGLADHPMGFLGKIKVKWPTAKLFGKLSMLDRGEYVCRSVIRLKSECGKYTGCAFLRPALTMENNLVLYKYKSALGASSGLTRLNNALSLKLFHPDILAEIWTHLFQVNLRSRIYSLLLVFEQKQGTNNVSYEDGKIKVDWGINETELTAYNSILEKLKDMLQPIADELVLKMPLTDDWLWSAAHHSGTVPMGTLPDGLIDKNLKVNFFENVFICDGSVVQEHSYANTGLTIGQLALRLADYVKKM